MSLPIQMPNLCAKCAENPPTQAYTIQRQQFSVSPWTLLTMFIGVQVWNRKTTFYQFPICSDCNDHLVSKRKFWGRVFIIGLMLFTAGILLLFSQPKALNTVALLATLSKSLNSRPLDLIVNGLIIIGVIIMTTAVYRGAARVVSISMNGKTFKFYNKNFQMAYENLNPHLIKDSKRKR